MAFYECVFIARQDITAAQVETLTETFTQILKDQGGQVTKTEQWGLRSLSFKIKKNRKGHYVLLNIDAPSAAVVEMERNLGLNEDVLRFMTVRVEQLDPNPSAVLQNRGERTEKGERGDRPDRGERGERGGRRFDGERRQDGERGARGGFRRAESEGAAQ